MDHLQYQGRVSSSSKVSHEWLNTLLKDNRTNNKIKTAANKLTRTSILVLDESCFWKLLPPGKSCLGRK